MSDLKTYLAAKYMSGPKADAILAKAKKKKPKKSTNTIVADGGGLIIADDDGMEWANSNQDREEEEEALRTAVIEKEKRTAFAKSAKNEWSTIKEGDGSVKTKISRAVPIEQQTVVDLTKPKEPKRGGLQTAAQVREEQEAQRKSQEETARQQAEEKAALKALRARNGEQSESETEDHEETVYRDASGKKIDVKLMKAEKAKKERENMEKQIKKMEWGVGVVQKEEREKDRKMREELAMKPMARYADDEQMNEELKEVERWNDPAANFLTKKKTKAKTGTQAFPSYKGPAPPPNRFGIKPGYRWDGVQRGNGFEAKLMQSINNKSMQNAVAYQYSTDDM